MSYESTLHELHAQTIQLTTAERSDVLMLLQGWYQANAAFIDSGLHATPAHGEAIEDYIRALTAALDSVNERETENA